MFVIIGTNVPALGKVENLVTFYFQLKIKILAKREHELATKFAIVRNGCYKPFLFVIPVEKYFLIISCVSD